MALTGFVALICFGIGWGLRVALPFAGVRPTLLLLYPPARLYLIFAAARASARFARAQASSEGFPHLYMTALSPRDLLVGWALEGWLRASAETLLIFAFLAPWANDAGAFGICIGIGELVHVAALQGLAAVLATQLTLRFNRRWEGAAAGWIAAGFSYPILFLAQALLFAPLLFALPFAFTLLSASGEGWGRLLDDLDPILHGAFYATLVCHYLWLPMAVLKEIGRQLDSRAPSVEDLRGYLEGPQA